MQSLDRFMTFLEPRRLCSHTPTSADYEQYMIELINRARANPSAEAARLNIDLNEGLPANTITTDPKQPLAYNADLAAAARTHSQWMLDNQLFQHAGANGDAPADRMTAAGYQFSPPDSSAENIAWSGSTGSIDATAITAQLHDNLFIDAGISDRGHRTNLMNPDLREIGAGVLTGTFQGYNAVMATNDFASTASSPGPFLTGVAYADTVVADHFYTPGEGLANLTITATRLSDNQTFTTTTSSAGGYAMQLPAGTYDITATGSSLSSPISSNNITISSLNVKQDFIPSTTSTGGGTTGGGTTGGGTTGGGTTGGGTTSNSHLLSVSFTSSLPATFKPGQSTKITLNFHNVGTAKYVATLHPSILFSTNTTIDSADKVIGHTTTPLSLAVGASLSVTFNVTFPVGLADGKYHVLAEDGTTPIAGTSSTTHIIPPPPNLAVSFSSPPKKSRHGSTTPFTLKLKNTTSTLAAGTAKLTLTLHPTTGGKNIKLPIQTLPPLSIKANSTSTLKSSITLPSNLHPGSYTLIATLSTTLPIRESSTTDNTITSTPFTVT
jgi:uncharacterized protein YkwD